jgi:hypothetical protein
VGGSVLCTCCVAILGASKPIVASGDDAIKLFWAWQALLNGS